MDKENKKVPKLRFQGFANDWEQHKLSELCKIITVGIANSATHAYRESGIAMFRNQNIKENHLDDSDIIYIDEEFEKKYINKRLRGNDLLIARTGYPGTACVVPEKYEGSQTFTTLIARLKEGTNPFFACQYINSYYGKKYISATQIGGGQKNSGAGILEDFPMMLPPTIEEQNIIAEFMTKLDNTITLHQRKLDQIKEYKKGMLQKMFPKKGETVPEVRFPGFEGDWEERKLSACAGFRRGSFPQPYGNKEWYDGEDAMPFVQVADVAEDMKLVDNTKQKISKVAQPMSVFADKGSVLVTLQGSIGRVAITQYGAFVDRTVLIFDKYMHEIDKIFWAYIIKEKFIDEARKAPGGTIKTITKEALSDFDLMLPKHDEQQKIGAFLVSIDNLITLHQNKLDQMKEYKKGLLQQMFV